MCELSWNIQLCPQVWGTMSYIFSRKYLISEIKHENYRYTTHKNSLVHLSKSMLQTAGLYLLTFLLNFLKADYDKNNYSHQGRKRHCFDKGKSIEKAWCFYQSRLIIPFSVQVGPFCSVISMVNGPIWTEKRYSIFY